MRARHAEKATGLGWSTCYIFYFARIYNFGFLFLDLPTRGKIRFRGQAITTEPLLGLNVTIRHQAKLLGIQSVGHSGLSFVLHIFWISVLNTETCPQGARFGLGHRQHLLSHSCDWVSPSGTKLRTHRLITPLWVQNHISRAQMGFAFGYSGSSSHARSGSWTQLTSEKLYSQRFVGTPWHKNMFLKHRSSWILRILALGLSQLTLKSYIKLMSKACTKESSHPLL